MEVGFDISTHSGFSNFRTIGGGLEGMKGKDFFLDANGRKDWFFNKFVNTQNTHGSGCTLSAAICSYRALGVEEVQEN